MRFIKTWCLKEKANLSESSVKTYQFCLAAVSLRGLLLQNNDKSGVASPLGSVKFLFLLVRVRSLDGTSSESRCRSGAGRDSRA